VSTSVVCRVGDLLPGELLELRLGQQHGVDVPADHHAGGRMVGELRVEGEAELLEKLDRLVEPLHRKVDEDLHDCATP
jgi:ubiquinone biosynthesis protein UbiJ